MAQRNVDLKIEPPGRHRWLRREVGFIVAAVLLIAIAAFLALHGLVNQPPHGPPVGTLPLTQPSTRSKAP